MNKPREYGNWTEIPPELTLSILLRLGTIEILENAQKVCRLWHRVCKDPSMWRKIEMHYSGDFDRHEIMCRHAIDRSQGGCVEIDIWYFCTDYLLNYISDSSRNLRSLRITACDAITDEGFVKTVVRLPLLEELEVSYCCLSPESLKVVVKSCLNLKILKLSCPFDVYYYDSNDDDEIAMAIAENIPELHHLQLCGNRLTNTGLKAILDACPHLEHLDLRECFSIELAGELEKRCSESIRVLRRPDDSTDDFPYF